MLRIHHKQFPQRAAESQQLSMSCPLTYCLENTGRQPQTIPTEEPRHRLNPQQGEGERWLLFPQCNVIQTSGWIKAQPKWAAVVTVDTTNED